MCRGDMALESRALVSATVPMGTDSTPRSVEYTSEDLRTAAAGEPGDRHIARFAAPCRSCAEPSRTRSSSPYLRCCRAPSAHACSRLAAAQALLHQRRASAQAVWGWITRAARRSTITFISSKTSASRLRTKTLVRPTAKPVPSTIPNPVNSFRASSCASSTKSPPFPSLIVTIAPTCELRLSQTGLPCTDRAALPSVEPQTPCHCECDCATAKGGSIGRGSSSPVAILRLQRPARTPLLSHDA